MAYIINYQAEIGWKIDWQEAAALAEAAPIFLNNTQPNRGLNRKTSNYSGKQGFDIFVAMDVVVSKGGVNTTYRSKSPKGKVNNYDEPSVSPRDFTETLQLFDLDGNNLSTFLPNKKVVFRTTYELVNGGNIADYADAWGIHRIQEKNNTSYTIFEFSSVKPNVVNQPLTSDSGLLSVTYDGNKIITECLVDGTKLNIGAEYTISARLGIPNVAFEPPVALIDNIVPDVETGVTDFDLTFTTPYATFTTDDDIEFKVYNNNTSVLIETLTGKYGDNITSFTTDLGTPANSVLNFLTGVVASSQTLPFDKLAWATQNNLLHDLAIPLKLTATITQFETGLISNVAFGVFNTELQPAEYVGDLRYMSTDGRKLYPIGVDGTNEHSIAVDLTLGFSNELFTPANGTQINSLLPLGDSSFGTPYSKLLAPESNLASSPYQWLNRRDTADGINWVASTLKTNIAGAGAILNYPTKDDIRTLNLEDCYWVGTDLSISNLLYLVYYDGSAWQQIDFSSLITPLFTGTPIKRVDACILYDGDVYGYAVENGVGGQKYIFRLRQTTGVKTTFADFSNISNWAVTLMAGGTAGTTDGNGTSAKFANPYNMVMIASASEPVGILLTDGNNYSIRLLTYNAGLDNYDVSTIVGQTGTPGNINDVGTDARLGDVRGMALDASAGIVYFGDLTNLKIKKVNLGTLLVSDFSGNGNSGYRLATLY